MSLEPGSWVHEVVREGGAPDVVVAFDMAPDTTGLEPDKPSWAIAPLDAIRKWIKENVSETSIVFNASSYAPGSVFAARSPTFPDAYSLRTFVPFVALGEGVRVVYDDVGDM